MIDQKKISTPNGLDILFYAENGLHLPFLEPIHDYLKGAFPELNLGFSSPPYRAATAELTGTGLPKGEISRIQKKGLYYSEAERVVAELAVMADVCHHMLPHIPRVVNVGHGLISKGLYYCSSPTVRRENLSEMICVPGPWHKKILQENVFVPIEITGFIKSDILFGPNSIGREAFCKKMDINQDKKIILYAPTYNKELSSIPVIQQKIEQFLKNDTVLMIKLHCMTPHCWVEMYKNLAKKNHNIFFLEDADYSGMMHAADIMISDVSSIFVEFLLLNKPVVLLENPDMLGYQHFDKNNIEYKIRNAVQVVYKLNDLFDEVCKALSYPDKLKSLREDYIEKIDYGRDGQSAKRAGDAICAMLKPDASIFYALKEKEFSIFLFVDKKTDVEILKFSIEELKNKAMDYHVKVFLVGDQVSFGSFLKYEYLEHDQVVSFSKAIFLAQSEFVVILRPGWTLPRNYLKWMRNHFAWTENVGLVKAISDIDLAKAVFERFLPSQTPPFLNDFLASILLTIGIGSKLENDFQPSPCVMIRLSDVSEWILSDFSCLDEDVITCLERWVVDSGFLSVSALDTFIYPLNQEFILWDEDSLVKAFSFLKKQGRLHEAVELMQKKRNFF